MITRSAILAAALLLVVGLAGCKTENGLGGGSAPVALSLVSITPSSSPFGDVWDSSVGSYRPDTVDVVFQNDLLNQDMGATYMADVVLKTFRVSFVRTDGGTQVPAGYQEAINVIVPANGIGVIENLTIVRATQKQQPPLYYLTPFSYGYEPDTGFNNISCNVNLEFWGETIAGDKVYASGAIGITFADYVNSSSGS